MQSLQSLPAYLNTLLPEYLAPAASAVGTDKALLGIAKQHAGYLKLLLSGCSWLDMVASENGFKRFSDMPEAYRIQVISAAEKADGTSVQQFFRRTRDDAFKHYYAQPATWSYLGFNGPPQPAGFMDFTQAPDKSS